MVTPSRFDLEQAATAFFKELTQELDRPRPFDPEHFDDDVRFNVDCSRERTRELDDQLRSNIFDDAVRSKAAELTSSLPVQDFDPSMKLYALQLAARAEREQLELHIHLLTKPASRFMHHDQFFDPDERREVPPLRPAQARPGNALFSSILRLSDATEEYQHKMALRGLGRSHVTETKRALAWLQERLGTDADVDAITKRQLSVFRDDLSRLDIRLRGRVGSFNDRLTNDPQHQIKSVTAIRYWRSIQSFFDWCAAEHDLDPNPAAGLKLQPRKGDARQSPEAFSQQELMQLFKTPLYNGYRSLKRVGQRGNCHVRNGQWWAGVLLMYTAYVPGNWRSFCLRTSA